MPSYEFSKSCWFSRFIASVFHHLQMGRSSGWVAAAVLALLIMPSIGQAYNGAGGCNFTSTATGLTTQSANTLLENHMRSHWSALEGDKRKALEMNGAAFTTWQNEVARNFLLEAGLCPGQGVLLEAIKVGNVNLVQWALAYLVREKIVFREFVSKHVTQNCPKSFWASSTGYPQFAAAREATQKIYGLLVQYGIDLNHESHLHDNSILQKCRDADMSEILVALGVDLSPERGAQASRYRPLQAAVSSYLWEPSKSDLANITALAANGHNDLRGTLAEQKVYEHCNAPSLQPATVAACESLRPLLNLSPNILPTPGASTPQKAPLKSFSAHRESCFFPELLQEDALALAAISGRAAAIELDHRKFYYSFYRRISAIIHSPEKPIFLHLGGSTPTLWFLYVTPMTRVLGVEVGDPSHALMTVVGLDPQVPILRYACDVSLNEETGALRLPSAQGLTNSSLNPWIRFTDAKVYATTTGNPPLLQVIPEAADGARNAAQLWAKHFSTQPQDALPARPTAITKIKQAMVAGDYRTAVAQDVMTWIQIRNQVQGKNSTMPQRLPALTEMLLKAGDQAIAFNPRTAELLAGTAIFLSAKTQVLGDPGGVTLFFGIAGDDPQHPQIGTCRGPLCP
jgi:hypothetical protein